MKKSNEEPRNADTIKDDTMTCQDWWNLTRADLRSDPARALALFKRLLDKLGRTNLEEDILLAWEHLGEWGRASVAYASHHLDGPSTELISKLFKHQTSTTRERHQLMAGLAVSCKKRGPDASKLLFDLLDQIGMYPEDKLGTYRQAILEKFIKSAKRHLSDTSDPE